MVGWGGSAGEAQLWSCLVCDGGRDTDKSLFRAAWAGKRRTEACVQRSPIASTRQHAPAVRRALERHLQHNRPLASRCTTLCRFFPFPTLAQQGLQHTNTPSPVGSCQADLFCTHYLIPASFTLLTTMRRPELARESPHVLGSCFTFGVGTGPKALPPPPPGKPSHSRRRSIGSWLSGKSQDSNTAEVNPSSEGAPEDKLDKLAHDLSKFDLEEDGASSGAGNSGSAGGKAADKGSSAATAPPHRLHRRRWSFGRQQVAPQPDAAAQEPGSPVDDLLVSSSDISVNSARSSPHQAAAAAAAAAASAAGAARQRSELPVLPPPQQQQQQQQHISGHSGAAPTPATPPQQRGPGYRRLWHSITSVRKGDPLPLQGGSGPSSDVTVESLVKATQVRADEPMHAGGAGNGSWGACRWRAACMRCACARSLCGPCCRAASRQP